MRKKTANERVYLDALSKTKKEGTRRRTRNGITTAIFAHQMRFNLQESFAAITTKKLFFHEMKGEALWFLDAGRETGYRLSLDKFNEILGKPAGTRNIWSNDQSNFEKKGKAQFPGDCGRIYGAQWRNYRTHDGNSIDQIAELIKRLKEDPFSRYHVVTAWNPGEINDMCLPPCHMQMQFFVRNSRRKDGKKYLDLSMDQRSCDMFLGVPFNIASYALINHMVAQCVGMIPGELVITLKDCHIYLAGYTPEGKVDWSVGHMKAVNEQLGREPLAGPKLWLNPEVTDIDGFKMDDIKLIDYHHHEPIRAKLL